MANGLVRSVTYFNFFLRSFARSLFFSCGSFVRSLARLLFIYCLLLACLLVCYWLLVIGYIYMMYFCPCRVVCLLCVSVCPCCKARKNRRHTYIRNLVKSCARAQKKRTKHRSRKATHTNKKSG